MKIGTFRRTKWDVAVESACREWEGTKYKLNRSTVGVGVDCLHFAASILDRMYGSEHGQGLASLPPDACIHNRVGVRKAARELFEKYPGIKRVKDRSVEAGDLILFGLEGCLGSTQHLKVAGSDSRLWHATPPSVHYTGLVSPEGLKLVCTYRASDKEKWSC